MENTPQNNRRQFDRFETDVKIQFYVNFDLETKINFRVKDPAAQAKSYSAVGQNISVEGLNFVSEIKVEKDSVLLLEVWVPSAKQPIIMEGQVRWVKESAGKYTVGVKLITVNGSAVEPSIIFDKIHHMMWSIVLETVFGGFKELVLKQKKSKEK